MTFDEYQRLDIRQRARSADRMRHERAIALFCKALNLTSCSAPGTMIHNARIDCDTKTGWMRGTNRQQVAMVKRAHHLLNDWSASRIADRIYSKVTHK